MDQSIAMFPNDAMGQWSAALPNERLPALDTCPALPMDTDCHCIIWGKRIKYNTVEIPIPDIQLTEPFKLQTFIGNVKSLRGRYVT